MAFCLSVFPPGLFCLKKIWPYGASHKMYSVSQSVRYMKLRAYTLQYIIRDYVNFKS
jgi:hypothetical protein